MTFASWTSVRLSILYITGLNAALGASPQVVGWVRSFLANCLLQVRIDDFVSKDVTIPSDIPQGSVISPLLFLVMMSDLSRDLQLLGRIFAYVTELGGESDNFSPIQLDLEWTNRNSMLLDAV